MKPSVPISSILKPEGVATKKWLDEVVRSIHGHGLEPLIKDLEDRKRCLLFHYCYPQLIHYGIIAPFIGKSPWLPDLPCRSTQLSFFVVAGPYGPAMLVGSRHE